MERVIMIKVLDNEGELVDVSDKKDLQSRMDLEDQDLMDLLYDPPFFADVIGESDYGNNDESDFDQAERVTLTYREWMDACLESTKNNQEEVEVY